jgi:hypothetical protein
MTTAQDEQRIRKETILNDLRVSKENEAKLRNIFRTQSQSQISEETGTFHDHAQSDAASGGGRWAAQAKSNVTGSEPSTNYPTLPSASPWHDGNAVEPPLGIDVNETPIVGEAWEVEASIHRLAGDATCPKSSTDSGAEGDAVLPVASPSTIRKRKI